MSGYKVLIEMADRQKRGVVLLLSNGQRLRGSVTDGDADSKWVRFWTEGFSDRVDGPDSGPAWINEDHIVAMWWAPDFHFPIPHDVAMAQQRAEEAEEEPHEGDDAAEWRADGTHEEED